MKRVSDDNKFELEFDFFGNTSPVDRIEVENIEVPQYLLCKYDDRYWTGMVLEIDQTANDVRVKFMHIHIQVPRSIGHLVMFVGHHALT